MANVKITELPALTTPVAADLIEVVDDVAGTPTSKKAEVGDLPFIAETLFDAAGDLITASGADTPVRLAKGDPLDVLRVNAAGTALEYAAPSSGGDIAVEDDGTPVVATATALNFTGAGVTVTDSGGGVADVNIPSDPVVFDDHGTTGSTETIDASAADVHLLVLDEDTVTITLTGWPVTGEYGFVRVIAEQDGTGGREFAWPGSVVNPPTLQTDPGAVDTFDLETWDGGTSVIVNVGPAGPEGPEGPEGPSGSNNGLTTIYKTADETVNNSAVLQNDNELLFAIGASEVWVVTCYLRATCTNASADIKFATTLPASATGWHGINGLTLAVDSSAGDAKNQSIGTTTTALSAAVPNTSNSDPLITYCIYVENSTNAGTVQVQWAQNTQTVVDTVLKKGSYMMAVQVA